MSMQFLKDFFANIKIRFMPFIKSLSSRFTKYYFYIGSYLPLFTDFDNNCANIFCILAMILIFLNFIKSAKDKNIKRDYRSY